MHLSGTRARSLAAVAGVASVALAAAWYAGYMPVPAPGALDPVPLAASPGDNRQPDGTRVSRTTPRAPLAARAVPAAPTPPAPAQLSAEQRGQVDLVSASLRDGPTLAGCRAAQATLLALARSVPARSPAWHWVLGRASECLRAPHAFRNDNALLEGLLESFPDDARVRALAGLRSYDAGRLDQAAAELEDAVEEEGSFEAWESYADAQLSRALALRSRGEPGWEELLMQAEAAALRALELADGQSLPLALHTVARTQLELGRPAEAIQWADQAVAALQAAGSSYQAVMAAELYVFSGQVYYRAGQRDTGLAYMDQGIAIAASPQQQAALHRIREEFLRRYGG